MSKTVILETGGNMRSVDLALRRCGLKAYISRDPLRIQDAERLILPGQGRFGTVARLLDEPSVRQAVLDSCRSKPVLAICVGMQLLFEGSDEDSAYPGLGLLPGRVRRLVGAARSPHMGWNRVQGPGWPASLTGDYYFAHSYWCDMQGEVAAWVECGDRRPAVVRFHGVWGVQFHPERSGILGQKLIKEFLKEC